MQILCEEFCSLGLALVKSTRLSCTLKYLALFSEILYQPVYFVHDVDVPFA
jgi:hypothetical protein